MGKKGDRAAAIPATSSSALSSGSTATFDPTLSALFSSSAGPVKVPEKSALKNAPARKQQSAAADLPTPDTTSSEAEQVPESDGSISSESEQELEQERPKKRRRVQDDELEDVYFRKLANAEERETQQRQEQQLDQDEDELSDSPSNDLEDLSDEEDDVAEVTPVHESLAGTQDEDLADKTSRTIFLSNVSTAAIKDKASKKALLAHLESAFPKDADAKIESIRFRSTPYESGKGPKRASYATRSLMDETSSSTHAYVVLSSEKVAERVTAKLNGTVVLDRHLHVDRLGSPFQTDHRRCIFVGNLPFVDQETMETNEEDNPRKRPKAKLRADPEEGLWQTFGKVGKVENVRMVRDKATRIGKGFAYVQFADENAVEAALLMDEKKFPPLLPRKLRIMRAKKTSTKPKQMQQRAKQEDRRGRGKVVQQSRKRDDRKGRSQAKTGSNEVFEGHRASKSSAKDRSVKTKGKKRPATRSAKRGAAFKTGGGKKNRDRK